jgi:hypothetical protein
MNCDPSIVMKWNEEGDSGGNVLKEHLHGCLCDHERSDFHVNVENTLSSSGYFHAVLDVAHGLLPLSHVLSFLFPFFPFFSFSFVFFFFFFFLLFFCLPSSFSLPSALTLSIGFSFLFLNHHHFFLFSSSL